MTLSSVFEKSLHKLFVILYFKLYNFPEFDQLLTKHEPN
jgi:hypothetical protein